MGFMGESREIQINGETWQAIRFTDERFRLFQSDWGREDRTVLPTQKGRCSYCLGESLNEDEETSVCESCGESEVTVCTKAETVGEVKMLAI